MDRWRKEEVRLIKTSPRKNCWSIQTARSRQECLPVLWDVIKIGGPADMRKTDALGQVSHYCCKQHAKTSTGYTHWKALELQRFISFVYTVNDELASQAEIYSQSLLFSSWNCHTEKGSLFVHSWDIHLVLQSPLQYVVQQRIVCYGKMGIVLREGGYSVTWRCQSMTLFL